ncbi:hypothetical protein ASPZODRAFT_134746 [Penicilliopsis zonata CBS 506.65]|uniref:Uncharacterized protein n=1 Tax=Penicilliopsis zonata CBS 506.65 TaxID=1073090 RepID=A0A1L9SBY2_9EURO|nr:hypothetical protein ASPZODRAFT_134746 [Penicilliopsis zonata CBS 506.65]OJJ44663.1 hypothetical protein ASPZODRAFT_134746 [Penicilliopsis zonata CBS 506.65]
MSNQPPLLRPRPRRPFELSPSNEPSEPSSPAEYANADHLLAAQNNNNNNNNNNNTNSMPGSEAVSRTGSVMNLTSSTLYGIYSSTAFEGMRDESSPWGTEAHSPPAADAGGSQPPPAKPEEVIALQRTRSRLSHGLFRGVILPRALRSALLFGFGIAYGFITVHLHENHWITPVKLENLDCYSWEYLGFWGLAGVIFGNVLPWLDLLYAGLQAENNTKRRSAGASDERTLSWNAAVRSVGAFVGIAFAMRRTPWESTTQASVTLALVNPVLWYLIDRTKTGFVMSTIIGLSGMALFLGLHPDMIPGAGDATASTTGTIIFNVTGADLALGTSLTQESIAVRTWVASVLFCACVCFGNIGRQLAFEGSN